MNKTLFDGMYECFRPQPPFWACEFTSSQVVVAGVDSKRTKILGRAAVDLPAGSLAGSLTEANIRNPGVAQPAVREGLERAGFKGFEIGLVIPDEAARISFLTAENLPSDPEELRTFIRWKLKKTVPFDVDTAQVAYRLIDPSELLVALSPRSVIEEYENFMEGMGLHAGFVVPSTLAAMNLFHVPGEDTLFLKVAADCVTTTVFQNRRIRFYRKVSSASLYDAVYRTVLYYQDKLGGQAFSQMTVCAPDPAIRSSMADLQDRLNLRARRLEPVDIDDVFKPALGAVELSAAV